MTQRKPGDHRHPQHKPCTHSHREILPHRPGEERILRQPEQDVPTQRITREQEQEEPSHRRSQNPHFLHHLAQRKTLRRGLRLRKTLPEEHHPVNQCRNQIQTELRLPAPVVPHRQRDQCPENHPRRPASMQNVQVMRPVVREQRRHQRIRHRFKGPVRQRENKRPREQQQKRRLLPHRPSRHHRHQRRYHMQQKRRNDQLPIPDLVHNDPANNNAETESGKTCPADQTGLKIGKSEFLPPGRANPVTDGKSKPSCQNGHKPCPQQSFGVRCYTFVVH